MIKFSAVVAIAAMMMPATAHADAKLSPQDTQAAVRYSLPHLLTAVRTSCSGHLPANGYFAREGDKLMARFSEGADAQWPAAKSLLLQMGAKDTASANDAFAQMPDDALKPFVNAIIASTVAGEIKADDCPDIERGLELIAPLPADNIAGLVGFIIEMTERKKAGAEGK